jgi:hypothetical protein
LHLESISGSQVITQVKESRGLDRPSIDPILTDRQSTRWMGELYNFTTNPIIHSNNMERDERKDTSNYMKSKPKDQIFAYLKFIAYTGNS